MRTFLVIGAIAALASLAPAPDAVRTIRERFQAALPTEKELAFYSLDWVPTLAEAKKRAREEDRPILLVINTNITAGTNFYTGHT